VDKVREFISLVGEVGRKGVGVDRVDRPHQLKEVGLRRALAIAACAGTPESFVERAVENHFILHVVFYVIEEI